VTVRVPKGVNKELAFEVALFAAGASEIALCHRKPILLTVLLAVTAIIAMAFWRKSHVVCFYLVGAVVGPCGEMICIRSGAWAYANPTFLTIPLWLPLAWGLVTVLIKGIVDTSAKFRTAS